MTIGQIIKNYRLERGLSQDDMAERTGLSKSYISILERNRNPKTGEPPVASLKTIKLVAQAIGLDFDAVFSQLDPNLKIAIGEQLPETVELPSNALEYNERYVAPVVGSIPAGYPAVALEDIEGYEPIPYPDPENYFFLRVSGNSMINAGIQPGSLVLIRRQDYAEPGQIVACRVNGDEATLKRYKPQPNGVLLMPENSDYEPQIVSAQDFESGYAGIIGVALEVRRKL